MNQEILYIDDVAAILGKKYPAVQAMVQRGQIPAPFTLGGRSAWRRATIDAWIEGLEADAKAKREGAEASKGRRGRRRLDYSVEIARA